MIAIITWFSASNMRWDGVTHETPIGTHYCTVYSVHNKNHVLIPPYVYIYIYIYIYMYSGQHILYQNQWYTRIWTHIMEFWFHHWPSCAWSNGLANSLRRQRHWWHGCCEPFLASMAETRCKDWPMISSPYANHGAGICTPTFAIKIYKQSPKCVGKYTSTMVRI